MGSEIAAPNRKSLATFHRTPKSQCNIAFSCFGNRAISGARDGHRNRKSQKSLRFRCAKSLGDHLKGGGSLRGVSVNVSVGVSVGVLAGLLWNPLQDRCRNWSSQSCFPDTKSRTGTVGMVLELWDHCFPLENTKSPHPENPGKLLKTYNLAHPGTILKFTRKIT